ncbi:protein argonaute-4-like isoform X3 [Pseudomyrmex gracilis]|uniref:protein argonaute-4-like isoform X3 n=1 Tax=Pseudomyrmex gracilis TaxID=219809 RepID=UPI000994FDCF|nr:protein argonaute-4-like isoform X3 [Pseudomyrmex gracilis]
MTKKGKKKNQGSKKPETHDTFAEAAETPIAGSSSGISTAKETSDKCQIQETENPKVSDDADSTEWIQQTQRKKQKSQGSGSSQQQQKARGQRQTSAGLPQQQTTSQQQASRGLSQQGARGQQQASAGLPQQQQKVWDKPQSSASLPQQQQGAWGHQQVSTGLPQQQQRVRSHQQASTGLPQQQQGARSHQQAPTGLPQQQQGAWGHQQAPAGLPQQQQGAWGHQQAPTSLPQQQQGAWGHQQAPTGLPHQQQGAWNKPQSSQPQQTLQTQELLESKMSGLSLKEPLQTEKTTSQGKLSTSTQKEYQLIIPTRKNPNKAGTMGKPIRVVTNMFEIIFKENFVTTAVHYDVSFDRPASKTICRKLFEIFRRGCCNNRYPAYDGKKNAYSAYDLPFGEYIEQYIILDDEDVQETKKETEEARKRKKFKITLKKVAVVDLSWIKNLRPGLDEANRDQTSIQVLDIILRHASESRALVTVGRSMFWNDKEESLFSLGDGLSLKVGAFQSAVLGWKAHLNVDVANKAFPTCQNVVNLMDKILYERNPTRLERCLENVSKFLTNLKVVYTLPNTAKRTYRVNGLGPAATHHKFDFNGSEITIEDYFRQVKRCRLHYPDLPCLSVGNKKDSQIFLPAELCKIAPGQIIHRKLNETQTTQMIKQAATSAPMRQKSIQTTFKKLELNKSDVMNKEFHLTVDTNMKEVDARILSPPVLLYNESQKSIVKRGAWNLQQFCQAQNLVNGSWTVLNLCIGKDRDGSIMLKDVEILNFVDMLKRTAPEVGMTIGDPLKPFGQMHHDKIDDITRFCNLKKNLALIMVVIPDRTDETYGRVKQITELRVGVLTQCIKVRTVKKANGSTIKNILLKINSKLNGINHTFNKMPSCLENANCMLVGADVTHPSPDSVNIPSIAAVASSHDKKAFQYNIELRLQEPKTEIIRDLEDIIRSQIRIYHKRMGTFPKRIIYYRDGVSEGQLAQVMHSELTAIKRAAQAHKIKVEVTCLVVQKRHHIRLFPTRDEDSEDKNKNVKAGTIVDTGITHPNHIDFYLVSHASIQGTARPTKYRCICNDSNFDENQIEELTYYLCHMYARCTRAVSYPAPTYYAHLAAYRGRALIQGVDIRLDNLAAEQKKIQLKMTELPMYFV